MERKVTVTITVPSNVMSQIDQIRVSGTKINISKVCTLAIQSEVEKYDRS